MYAYQADLWCGDCADKIKADLRAEGREDTGDTDDWPQWGSDEEPSDTPWHCAGCGVFLENPLTEDGERYVGEHLAEALCQRHEGMDVGPCIADWWDTYAGNEMVARAIAVELWERAKWWQHPADRDRNLSIAAAVLLRRLACKGIEWLSWDEEWA